MRSELWGTRHTIMSLVSPSPPPCVVRMTLDIGQESATAPYAQDPAWVFPLDQHQGTTAETLYRTGTGPFWLDRSIDLNNWNENPVLHIHALDCFCCKVMSLFFWSSSVGKLGRCSCLVLRVSGRRAKGQDTSSHVWASKCEVSESLAVCPW